MREIIKLVKQNFFQFDIEKNKEIFQIFSFPTPNVV